MGIRQAVASLLHDGGPSSTRLINLIVAVTGAWLLYYWARAGGDMGWEWCACFIAYLVYGAGPHVVKQAIDAVRDIKTNAGSKSE